MGLGVKVDIYNVKLELREENFSYEQELSEYSSEKGNHVSEEVIQNFIGITRDIVNFNAYLSDTDLVIKTIEKCNISPVEWEKILEHFKISFDHEGYVQQEK